MTLYIVATPIGNLQDVTLRCLETLKSVDAVLAEDTRQTKKLLVHFDIPTKLITVHQHATDTKLAALVEQMGDGKNFALVTDAGTPGVSDPGGKLVKLTREANIPIVPIPGASAVTTLVSVAGMPTDSFLFLGFLPKKGRQTLWHELKEMDVPLVIFESPFRIKKTLGEVLEHLGDRRVVIGRELTKLHEEILDLKTTEATAHFEKNHPRGEFVILIAPEKE
jgi:16S rRNA (cytidine1402-2'-O)-methyltransferase